jgi:GTP-binding protein
VDIVDTADIVVRAGAGGNGVVSFRHEKFVPFGGPDGGDGGKGGNVLIKADGSITNLSFFRSRRQFKAQPGKSGSGQKKHGKNGEDLEILVPPGTVVYIDEGEDILEFADLNKQGECVVVAEGGRGGKGNVHFTTSTNQAPRVATKGEQGEERHILLDLKLIADVGIVGYPNVGKSTLLAAVSAAKPRIAEYAFTTLEPVLGEVVVGKKVFILAEVPGIIQDAHLGKGLGYEFLRHAERTKVLIHLLDGKSDKLIDDFNSLNMEMTLYNPELVKKPQIIAINKVDLPEVKARLHEIKKALKAPGYPLHLISAINREGTRELMAEVVDVLSDVNEREAHMDSPVKIFRPKPKEK